MLSPPENDDVAEETHWLARIGRGDREAFRQLYSRYRVPLFSLVVRLVGDQSESEERLQDAFVKIWQGADSYDARKSRPFTWAVTIARRTCIDHLRKRRGLPPVLSFPGDDESIRPEMATGEDVRRAAESGEDSERLHEALAEIPGAQRRALELALFSEFTHEEIARQLQQPVGTVKSWIRRGLLGLRTTLSDHAV